MRFTPVYPTFPHKFCLKLPASWKVLNACVWLDGAEPGKQEQEETHPRVCISSCEFSYTPVRKTDTEQTQRRAGEKTIEETSDVDVTFYTDGSAEEGTRNGGAGVVVIDGSDTLQELSEPARQLTSSFQGEMTAIRTAVR